MHSNSLYTLYAVNDFRYKLNAVIYLTTKLEF